MLGPEPRLHLPYSQWPATDRLLWQQGFGEDDPFAQVRLSESLAGPVHVGVAEVSRIPQNRGA